MPELDDVKIEDLPNFTGDDASYIGDASLAREAMEAGVQITPSQLPDQNNNQDYEVVIDHNFKPLDPFA